MGNGYSKQVWPGMAWMILLIIGTAFVLMGATWMMLLVGDEPIY